MKYYALFDENGYRVTSYIEGIHIIPKEAITITEEEQRLYQTNKYKRGKDGKPKLIPEPEITVDEVKANKLYELVEKAQETYKGGFVSDCTGDNIIFDSTTQDQDNIRSMWGSTLSPDFETDEQFKGRIPMRGIKEGNTEKEVYLLDRMQMQKLLDDMNRHIGNTKIKHWQLQENVMQAETIEEVENIKW